METEYDYEYAKLQLDRSKNPLRKFIKKFYLSDILKDVKGPAIDFGCGAGQLLRRLPQDSIGLEVNPHLVSFLKKEGRQVDQYNYDEDKLNFFKISVNKYKTFILSHVLEHFDNASGVLRKISSSCDRLGIERLIVIVPGEKGYKFDKTHKTFVNFEFLEKSNLQQIGNYKISNTRYFPINAQSMGKIFTFHEFKFIYDKE